MNKLSIDTKVKGFAILLLNFAIRLDESGASSAFKLSGAREVADLCSTYDLANDAALQVIDDIRHSSLCKEELYKRIEAGLEIGSIYTEEEFLEKLKKLL